MTMQSDPALKRLYCQLNRRYFGGTLPVESVAVYWEPGGSCAAYTVELAPASDGNPPELAIVLDPALKMFKRYTMLVMSHEAAHVALWQKRGLTDHGRMFDREIQRLCTFRSYRRLL